MSRRSILHRRARRKIKKDFELQLTSMMDMLIILVVFLLKSYSTSAVAFSTSTAIQLPNSSAAELPGEAVNVIIEPQHLIVDGEKVVDFQGVPAPVATTPDTQPQINPAEAKYEIEDRLLGDGGRRILPLFDALMKAREKAEFHANRVEWKDKDGKKIEPPKFSGTLIIHADKAVQYQVLRKVMYTAGAAEFKTFKLVTMKKDAG